MKILILSVLFSILAGCTTIKENTRLTTNIKAKEYNSVYSNYIDRPTFTDIEEMSDGSKILSISRDNYGSTDSVLRFSKENIPSYIDLIDKYVDWVNLAVSRNDAITKEIGRAATWGNFTTGELKFVFHSGNSKIHYLVISFCAVGRCIDDQAFYFDLNNARRLKSLLVRFYSNNIKIKNIDEVYK